MSKQKRGLNGMQVFSMMIGVLLLVGLIIYFAVPQTQFDKNGEPIESISGCPESTGILTVSIVNALQQGTAVTGATITAVDANGVQTNVTSGTTTFTIGKKFDLLVSVSDYLDTKIADQVMTCGGLEVKAPIYYATSDNPSIRVKNDDGDYVTNAVAGGAKNQTDLSAGETFTFDVEFQGTNLESSGNLVYIIELPAGSSANVTDVLMPGATDLGSIPSVHTTINAGSKVVAFDVPAVVGAEKKTYSVSIVLGADKDLNGGVYTDYYAKQWFVDDDGSLVNGIQDSTGDAQYENTGDFDFLIETA